MVLWQDEGCESAGGITKFEFRAMVRQQDRQC